MTKEVNPASVFSGIMLFVLLCGNLQAICQVNLDHLMIKKQVSCQDVSLNSSEYIPYYFDAGLMDSAMMTLSYWGDKCGNSEPVMRATLLLALVMHYYSDQLLPENYLQYMDAYNSRQKLIKNNSATQYNYYQSEFDFVPIGGVFDNWSQNLAISLTDVYEQGSPEYLICLFYSGQIDSVYSLMANKSYADTKPGVLYYKAMQNILKLPSMSLAGYTGLWIPNGPLSEMGIHPEIGVTYGLKNKENLYELVMGFKFIHTPRDYVARRDKNSADELTNYFFGGYIGFEYSRDLIPDMRSGPFFSAGAAFDGFDMLLEDTDTNLKAASTGSYNFNLGGGYRIFLNRTSYLGIQARYNLVDYTLSQKFDLKGHVISLRLTYGVFQNKYRDNLLEQLNYRGK